MEWKWHLSVFDTMWTLSFSAEGGKHNLVTLFGTWCFLFFSFCLFLCIYCLPKPATESVQISIRKGTWSFLVPAAAAHHLLRNPEFWCWAFVGWMNCRNCHFTVTQTQDSHPQILIVFSQNASSDLCHLLCVSEATVCCKNVCVDFPH